MQICRHVRISGLISMKEEGLCLSAVIAADQQTAGQAWRTSGNEKENGMEKQRLVCP